MFEGVFKGGFGVGESTASTFFIFIMLATLDRALFYFNSEQAKGGRAESAQELGGGSSKTGVGDLKICQLLNNNSFGHPS